MFDPTSRYYNIENAALNVIEPDGTARQLRYVRRRFLPGPGGTTTLVEHTVTQGERLDNITARYISDPLQFWRICDSNNVMRPDDLTDEIGRTIGIAMRNL